MTQLTDTILMVRPAAFHYNPETAANNFFQNEPSLQASQLQEAALREFDGMVALLRSKDIDVIVIDDTPTPAKPDQQQGCDERIPHVCPQPPGGKARRYSTATV
jgi:hypothetical protein